MADSPKVPLTDKPGPPSNWVEKYNALGGKTNWIRRTAEHLKGKGMTDSHAIAVAVNAAQKLCEENDLNFPGHQSANPGSRAEACAAYKRWNDAKLRAKAARATNLSTDQAYETMKSIDLAAHWIGKAVELTT